MQIQRNGKKIQMMFSSDTKRAIIERKIDVMKQVCMYIHFWWNEKEKDDNQKY